MIESFFLNKRWAIWSWGGTFLIIGSLYTQVQLTVMLNGWYGEFYDMLQKATEHKIEEFWLSFLKFSYIAFPYVFIATATSYVSRIYVLRWREAITFSYIPKWRNVEEEIEGASQRIQEDTAKFALIVQGIGIQLVRAIMTLIAFLPVLWGLSEHIKIPGLDWLNNIEGNLVIVSIATSFGALLISLLVGIKLPGLEYKNQKAEARFRKELVYSEDNKNNYGEIPTLTEMFLGIKLNYQKLYLHYGYYDIWSNIYSQTMIILPYLMAGPALFAGTILLGVIRQIADAFARVDNSFSLLINNWTTVTELLSVIKRLREFEKNIKKYN